MIRSQYTYPEWRDFTTLVLVGDIQILSLANGFSYQDSCFLINHL